MSNGIECSGWKTPHTDMSGSSGKETRGKGIWGVEEYKLLMVRMNKPKVRTIQINQSTIQLTHTYKNTILGCYFYIPFSFLNGEQCLIWPIHALTKLWEGRKINWITLIKIILPHCGGGGKKGIKSRLTKISFQLSSPYKKTIPGCYLFNSLSCINHRAVLNPTYKCSDQTAGGTGGTGGTNGPCV